ncbi:hypothetical protein CLV63_104118 [Murinocardiopsis flavida]|uniref:Pirin n=1 Tax=Murinocardiopsis flavida TaxID=645275 RepID=A0A2P8DNU5_9ACTN|nr:pirin family protein [Murinocardiopsis flavida]PSK98894.1 hypothetical protein CLV63_104118 [Murinocardiopsis flavida]
MSNLDPHPAESLCTSLAPPGPAGRVFAAREVPLGGVRDTTVRRTLPQRELPTVGAWCFLDEFGPSAAAMRVLPHPHTGLQTVTWPLTGRIRHRDSLGSDLIVRPGELNLMTGGHGVSHSEFSPADAGGAEGADGGEPLHGLQLWIALPESARGGAAAFEHHGDLPQVRRGPLRATVLVGSLAGAASAATVHSPLVGADISMAPGTAEVPLDPDFEHAVLVVAGSVAVAGTDTAPGPLLYLGTGRSGLRLTAHGDARLLLIGGAPFEEELVMWWNFIGRSHEDIARAREEWQRADSRFGRVAGHGDDRIPAPPLPNARLRPRRRPAPPRW